MSKFAQTTKEGCGEKRFAQSYRIFLHVSFHMVFYQLRCAPAALMTAEKAVAGVMLSKDFAASPTTPARNISLAVEWILWEGWPHAFTQKLDSLAFFCCDGAGVLGSGERALTQHQSLGIRIRLLGARTRHRGKSQVT
ncbi:hypothetical protein [Paraburkholderia sp. DHOC27]|uniref:hypothetical protein n=1 Tax=Paraburkholderia sp. DHOC27 TaxID=2303330 RepID=UPI0015F318E4|nr:hypothetical protein [Paraburkholderia sp. DHOC27]